MSKLDTKHIYSKIYFVFDKYITKYQAKLENHEQSRDVVRSHILNSLDVLKISDYYLDDVMGIDDILDEKPIIEMRVIAASHWHTKMKNAKFDFVQSGDGRSDLLPYYIIAYAYHTKIIEYCKQQVAIYRNFIFSRTMVLHFIRNINSRVSELLIEGELVKFSPKIGYIQLMQAGNTRKNLTVRWDKSIEFKKQLLANNIPVYSLDNPDGIRWIIKDHYDLNVWWIWKRGFNIFHRNNRRFIFRPTCYNLTGKNVEHWVNSEVSDKTIIKNTQLGNVFKTIILDKRNPQWHLTMPTIKFKIYGKPTRIVRGV